jgi:archaellum component FlaC
MEESIFKYLLDYGSLGITAGLLFWLYLHSMKQVTEIRGQSREDLEMLRDRYETVISKYDQDKDLFFSERHKMHNQIVMKIESIEKNIEKQESAIESIKDKVDQILLLRDHRSKVVG